MSKKRPYLVSAKGNALIANLSAEEESRALALADIALHNSAPQGPLPAGERARSEHRRLMEQVDRAAKKVLGAKRAA